MARKKNPINDIVDTVGAWFGGNRGTINPQVQRVQRDLGTVAQTIDTFGTGGVGQAALRDVRKFQQGGSLPTNLAKTTAVNLAAGAVGAKAAQVAGRAVAKTGIPARVANKLTGQEVLIHSSPKQNLKTILAQTSSDRTRFAPDEALSFAARPAAKGSQQYIPDYVRDLQSALRGSSVGVAGGTKPQSVYITKAPKKSVVPYQAQGVWGRTPSNQKVVQEIGMSGKTPQQLADEIAAATRRAGQPLRPEYNRAERLRMERAHKKWMKKNPPVRGPKID